MTETTQSTAAPKKRSFFKRAAWQDAPTKEEDDMFSHANEFKDIVADETRRRHEQEKERQRRHAESREKKRCKVSIENEASHLTESKPKESKPSRTIKSSTPPTPALSHAPPDSLATRYEALTKPTILKNSPIRKKPFIIDLDDEDAPSSHDASYSGLNLDAGPWHPTHEQAVPVRSSKHSAIDHEELEEAPDPTLAALEAKARQRAALKAQAAPISSISGEPFQIPAAQLLIKPQIPETKPLMVKVRIDSTLKKPREAWCAKQGLGAKMAEAVFFTWKGRRLHDSTTIQRLDVQVDQHGTVSVKGDATIYDDTNLPKIVVEAWTEELFQKRQQEDAAEEVAKKLAAEAPLIAEQKDPTPEPVTKAKKLRVVLKAKGKPEFGLTVHMDSNFGHVASAYKKVHNIDETQPITLMFDGERLSPIDTVAEVGMEDLDAIEVHFK